MSWPKNQPESLRQQGELASVLFIVQRSDATVIRPHKERDPDFATALCEAKKAGVSIHGVTFHVSTKGFHYRNAIPIRVK